MNQKKTTTKQKDWKESSRVRLGRLLGLIAALNLMDDYKEAEKQLKEGVEAFLKGNELMVKDLLSDFISKEELVREIKSGHKVNFGYIDKPKNELEFKGFLKAIDQIIDLIKKF